MSIFFQLNERRSNLKILTVDQTNLPIVLNLAQAYEAEFSAITKKKPQSNGLFLLDTPINQEHPSYLLYDQTSPIGFCIKGVQEARHDIAEFYVVPSYRSKGIGRHFAAEIFKKYPGPWQVRQIDGADKAILFWRSAIQVFTNNNFTECVVEDNYWGKVTRQLFHSP